MCRDAVLELIFIVQCRLLAVEIKLCFMNCWYVIMCMHIYDISTVSVSADVKPCSINQYCFGDLSNTL